MHELAVAPSGRFVLKEVQGDASSVIVPKKVLEAFQTSTTTMLMYIVMDGLNVPLPPSLEFGRAVARVYFTQFCKSATGQPGEALPEVPPLRNELEALLISAPPMLGLEYLTIDALETIWKELDEHTRLQVMQHGGGVESYLREHHSPWRLVGRVTFHLAENKRNPEMPFAFMATFANGLNAQGQVKHEPLQRALQQYAGESNREALLKLLLPISRAAEASPFIRNLVDNEHIYHPVAWSVRDAYHFLQTLPLLESSGVVVRVPDWWNAKKPPRPQVNVRVEKKNASTLNMRELLEFSVEMSLNGETLTEAEIEQLLQSGGGLVPLKGKWVEVDKEKLQEALQHWKQVERDSRHDGISFFAGMRLLSGAGIRGDEGITNETVFREWTGLKPGKHLDEILTRLRSPETQGEAAPPGLQANLREYQRVGYHWLRMLARLGLGACLADDMGLGKTIQVISLLLDLKKNDSHTASLLVVPTSLIANWKSEIAKFAPSLSVAIVHASEGNASLSDPRLIAEKKYNLVISTYGIVVRTEWIKKHPWHIVILDEAQAIKNSGTKQTRAVKELKAETRIVMTGTPIENRLSDLWSLFDFLNPGLLGSAKEFTKYVKQMQNSNPVDFAPLRNLIRPYILRRLKTDKRVISDLPDKTEMIAFCSLSQEQAAMYLAAVEELRAVLEQATGIQRRGIVLAQLMRLKQICNHPAQLSGNNNYAAEQSGKFQRLAEIVEEIASRQEKVLIFTQFREITEPLSTFLRSYFDRPGTVLHGGTSVKRRKEIVADFQSDTGAPYLVLSLKAGGTGLNLTTASHVVHFDRWWNPAIENQATDRAFRIGQKKNVLVHKFVCRGTVEEKIDEMIAHKSSVAGEVIGSGETGEVLLTEMDNAKLLEFVNLNLEVASAG